MRKAMFLLITSAMIFSFVGCGSKTSATSETSSATTDKVVAEKVEDETELAELKATEENEKLNNEVNRDETEIQEPEEVTTPRPEVNASTNWEDYLDGNTWNLTAYAEALGYTWMQDPEYTNLVMYNIRHGNNNYFVTYFESCVFVFLGTDHDGCWSTDGIITASGDYDILVASTAQDEIYVPLETVEQIAGIFSYIAGNDVDLTKIPSHAAYTLKHTLEPAQYFDNGLIRQRELGEVVDYQFCGN